MVIPSWYESNVCDVISDKFRPAGCLMQERDSSLSADPGHSWSAFALDLRYWVEQGHRSPDVELATEMTVNRSGKRYPK